MWKRLIWCWKIIKQYLSNCSIHGARYLVDDQLSYLERFFWLIACMLCWYGCVDMIKSALINYIEYPVAVSAETMYLHWVTPFPTVAFCISSSKTISNNYFKRNPGALVNYTNPILLSTTAEELLFAYEQMKLPCTKLLVDCEWNNVKFNCCAEFQELRKTGIGYCLAMNTFHLTSNGKPSVRYLINRTVQYGDLFIDINSTSKSLIRLLTVHLFNNYELPTINNVEKDEIHLKIGKTTRVEFTMYDTFNQDGVKKVAINRRNCRFSHEKRENSLFDIYSSDSCYLEVIIERMITFCGCVHFYYFIPHGARACNGTEMLCIIANKTNILSYSMRDEQCLPNCDGTSLLTNRWEQPEYESPNPSYSRLHFTLLTHPTVRYRRYVANDLLDVVVAQNKSSRLNITPIIPWLHIISADEEALIVGRRRRLMQQRWLHALVTSVN